MSQSWKNLPWKPGPTVWELGWQPLTVTELRALLEPLNGDLPVAMTYEADCCRGEIRSSRLEDIDGRMCVVLSEDPVSLQEPGQ